MLNTLIQWDCLEIMKTMETNSIDLTVTSPPYDNLRTYNGFSWDFEWVAKELYRVTKDWWVVVWVVWDATVKWSETGTSFKQALFFKEIGFNLHDTMIWYKTAIFPHHKNAKRYKQQFEYMFVFTKGITSTFNPICDTKNDSAGKNIFIRKKIKSKNNGVYNGKTKTLTIAEYRMRDNVWSISQEGNKNHPAPFPEKLAEDHILSWSNEWDTVLDPFAGSWTTLKMAKKNKRKYIGIEISPEYCEIINKRLTA